MAKNSIDRYKTIQQELTNSANRKPVYYFCGDEPFFLGRLQKTAESLVAREHLNFNLDIIYGRDKEPDEVLGIIRSFPMMAEMRVVIVRDFLSLNITSYQQTGRGGGLDSFIPYFEQPNPSTLLVLLDQKKPNGRTKLGKAIQKGRHVGFCEFKEVKDYLLPDWIISWTKTHHNKKLEPRAAQMLAQLVGSNLQLLSIEIDKASTFVDASNEITTADIKKILQSYREYSVFELKDALFSKNLENTLFVMEQMLHNTKNTAGEIIRAAGFFYNVFSNIWQIRWLASKGKNKSQIQSALGIGSSWYFNQLWKDASRFELSEMPRIFEALTDADSSAKGFTKMDSAAIFFLMVKRIIN